jgi:glutaconate CoA-transferase, subunit A
MSRDDSRTAAKVMPLPDAVAAHVNDGDILALEGFTHLIPFAAGHEIIRQERRDLTLVRLTPDLIYDQMIGMGCAAKMIFSYGGNPGVGSLHRMRDAVENSWPRPLALIEHSHAGMANAYVAGASRLPFGILRGYAGTDLVDHNDCVAFIECPFTGERLTAVRAVNPDVAVIHAQQADRQGNVMLWGLSGVQKEAVLAAERSIVTVEELVDELEPRPHSVILPSWVITAVCVVPGGSAPSYAAGYSVRDNDFYSEWDDIARDRDRFTEWMREHVVEAEVSTTA